VFAKIVLGLAAVALLVAFALPPITYIHWVGSKDLDLSFLVVDADSGEPVKAAKVEVLHEETNFCADRPQVPFTHAGGDDGIARHLSKKCMCFGTEGGWGRWKKDTFAIHIPGWYVRVEAPGYLASEPFYLDTFENQQNVVRGNKTATLEVVVKLHKGTAGKP
jgi:hypothetical protein